MTRGKEIAVWWATCLIWSSVWLVIKIGLRDVPPISFAGWRLALAVLAPLLIARWEMFRRGRGLAAHLPGVLSIPPPLRRGEAW